MTGEQHQPQLSTLTPHQRMRRVEVLAAWTKAALAGSALVWLIEAFSAIWLADLFDREGNLLGYFLVWFDYGPGLVALGWFITGGLFIWWHWAVRRTLRDIGRDDLIRSDAATLYWWFVPLANLIMPFRVASETQRASNTPLNVRWDSADTRPLLKGWTAALLSGIVITRAGLGDFTGSDPDESAFTWYAVGASITVIAGYLAIRLVDDVTDGLKKHVVDFVPKNQPAETPTMSSETPNDDPATSAETSQAVRTAHWDGMVSTLESLIAEGALSQEAGCRRAMSLLSRLNAEAATHSFQADSLARLNSRLVTLCENVNQTRPPE